MDRAISKLCGVAVLAAAVGACGGGGASSGFNPGTPAPPPPPPPPAAGLVPVDIFPGVTSSTEFATVGIELPPGSSDPLIRDGFAVRYDASSDRYVFDLPAHEPAGFYEQTGNTPSDSYWSGGLSAGQQPAEVWPPMSVLKPTNPGLPLTYTSFATYYQAGPFEDLPHGFVAFGFATPVGAVPVNGSATYTAIAAGASRDGNMYIGGSATLQFDFAQGTLNGQFRPESADWAGGWIPLGTYDFENTVYSAGSTSFSGGMRHASSGSLGSFDGLLTGPAAQELMAGWSAVYIDPNSQESVDLFGVWVGKRP